MSRMLGSSFDDVFVVNPSRIEPATADDVADLESRLGCRMPSGYADFVERLGVGALGHFVRVLGPTELPARTLEWRERIQEYWFWDTSESGVEPATLQQAGVLVADSFDGDELCFDPADPDVLFVLPRDEDVAYRAGAGLLGALEWMLSGAVLNPWVEGWTFETWTHRSEATHPESSAEALAAVAARVEALGEHAHVVDLGERRTYFLPAIGGRLSLYQFEGQDLRFDFTHDEAADPATVSMVAAALQ